MKKLNITKERFEKSRYFQKKYGKLEYVSESGKLFKTDKGNVLLFKEYTDGYEGLGRGFDADDDNPAYGQGCTGTARGARRMAELRADNERAIQSQIDGGVVLRRTDKTYDLWEIYALDGKLKLKGGFAGVDKAIKYAKKEGLKIIGVQHGSGKIEPMNESVEETPMEETLHDIIEDVYDLASLAEFGYKNPELAGKLNNIGKMLDDIYAHDM